ncbi:hypothetical protein Lser_V15G30264 [Lactuca serriola]
MGLGLPLHTYKHMPCTVFNRVFASIYICAIVALIYHHFLTLRHSTTFISVTITTSLLISDLILAFIWATTTSYRLRPILRQVFPENLEKILDRKDFPAIDIFICTADPYKEPPINVVNTALSLIAYDYPPEKISVYVSDDGGSELTLFAFMEAANFAKIWLPFCRDNNIMDRCPEAYFSSERHGKAELESEEIKAIYESMKMKVENVVERGEVCPDYIMNELQRQTFNKYRTPGFARSHHPPIIQVLINSAKEKDKKGHSMPNLVYVSRGKNNNSPHHFKAGALNTLLRFPQRYHGLNKDDIYGGEFLRLFVANPVGMDGLQGPSYVGSGCFFRRRVFFGGPKSMVLPEIPELRPNCVVEKPITSEAIIELAHHVADYDYGNKSKWGFELGFRYGSLVEDYFTGYRLQCQGWESIFCHPSRSAFLGDVPISLFDAVSQTKRWAIGLLEVGFSKYTPLVFGSRCMGHAMGLCYAYNAFWPILSIPIIVYSFIPQIALINGLYIFPEVTNPWFLLYVFVFLGAYAQDCYEFILFGSTFKRWWNDQRIWLIRGLSPYLFGLVEYVSKHLGIGTQGFNVTSKVQDDEQRKRYDKGLMEFGLHSLMFLPITTASIVSFFSLVVGIIQTLSFWKVEKLFGQFFIAGFGVLNSWPVYEAMILRTDKGRIPIKTTISSICLAFLLYGGAFLIL